MEVICRHVDGVIGVIGQYFQYLRHVNLLYSGAIKLPNFTICTMHPVNFEWI